MVKIKVKCAFCGEDVERKESQIAKSKTKKVFCNNGCRIAHERMFGNVNRGRHIQRGWRRPEGLSVAG